MFKFMSLRLRLTLLSVALVGIDNDPLGRMLARIPMSSVIHGAQEIVPILESWQRLVERTCEHIN